MQWEKIGKIFTPQDFKLPNNCKDFAQSPQVLAFDSFNRVFFSTREIDKTGKFLSHIAFVEFDKNFKNVLDVSKDRVISLGELGTFDEHGIFPLNILNNSDKVLGFIGGWSRRVSVSVETSIGLAISYNKGKTFERYGNGPVLSSSLNEPFLVGDPFVQKYNDLYHMWYIYGLRWINDTSEREPQRVYKIGHAYSLDAINWTKSNRQLIPDKLDENECQALPTVGFWDRKYHMFFCYRRAIGFRNDANSGYRIGYACSSDLKNWSRDDSIVGINISQDENDWDSEMQCYPHVFIQNEDVYLLYNGNKFGKFGFGLAKLIRKKKFIIEYSIDRADCIAINKHLLTCSNSFIPALSNTVNVEEYSKKIRKNAVTFEAWDSNQLVGLIAVYFNDFIDKIGYVTNVSILQNYKGNKISNGLLVQCIDYAKNNGFEILRLEVHKNNNIAINLYKKFGFVVTSNIEDHIKMELLIK